MLVDIVSVKDYNNRMRQFFGALKHFLKNTKNIEYSLLGSFNLYLQGIDVTPHDLDFITDNEGLKKISKIFKSNIISNNGYLETEFILDEIDIHIVSNENNNLREPFRNNIIWIDTKGVRIPCQSLESELRFYIKINREKDFGKVELIKKRIKSS